MQRREFITLIGGAAAAWPLAAHAQQQKVWRIGMLDTASRELNSANLAVFYKELRDFGYVEGQNLIIEYRSADGRNERLPDLVSELLRLNVDLIVVRGTPEVLAIKNATSTTASPGQIDGSSSTWRQCTSYLRFMLQESLQTTED